MPEIEVVPDNFSQWSGFEEFSGSAWLKRWAEAPLRSFVDQALVENFDLRARWQSVEASRESANIARSPRFPTLTASSTGQRGRTSASSVQENYEIGAILSFELDIWGRLAQDHKAARLTYAADLLAYRREEQRLVASVVASVFDLVTAKHLAQVFAQRLSSLTQSLDVIERGYRSGLNGALDVYLSQNTVQQERANVASQDQAVFDAGVALNLLLGSYPDGRVDLPINDLPELEALQGVGVPAQLLQRRLDVQSAWPDLLAADAELAVAHRQRFPALNISSSLRDNDPEFGNLLDGGKLAWSVSASLFQPLFQGGRLLALERQAQARVQQAEARYLGTVYDAFAEVETTLREADAVVARLAAFEAANENAQNALLLANDQYQRGLVTYTTVLESQRRAFDAETTVVQLNGRAAQVRVATYLALGGSYL